MLTICYPLHTDSLEFRELKKTRQATCFFLSTLNHWSFSEHTYWPSKPRLPKFPLKRLMSLGHKPKMRWRTSGFVVILCKYGLLLKKPLAVSVREVIWAVSFDSLLKPNPYVDVDNVMGLWSQLIKRKCGPRIHLLK